MKVRLAAFIAVCAALLLWLNGPSKTEVLAGTCASDNAAASDVISACGTLIDLGGHKPEYQHLFLSRRAEAHFRKRQYQLAIDDAGLALEVWPNSPRTLVWRAYAHNALKDQAAAQADFTQALQIDPESTYVHYNKAKLHRIRGELDASVSGYEKVLQLDPDHQNAAKDLINLKVHQGEYSQVESLLEQAQDRWSEQHWVYVYQIEYDLKYSGDVGNALTMAETLQRVFPDSSDGPYYLALINFRLGNEDQGIENVRSFAVLNIIEGREKLEFFDLWIRKFSNHIVLGQDEEWVVRTIFFASVGKADLATAEAQNFLDQTGTNGRKILLKVIRQQGVEVPPQADAGSTEFLKKAIADYIEHIRLKSELISYVSPEEQGT